MDEWQVVSDSKQSLSPSPNSEIKNSKKILIAHLLKKENGKNSITALTMVNERLETTFLKIVLEMTVNQVLWAITVYSFSNSLENYLCWRAYVCFLFTYMYVHVNICMPNVNAFVQKPTLIDPHIKPITHKFTHIIMHTHKPYIHVNTHINPSP